MRVAVIAFALSLVLCAPAHAQSAPDRGLFPYLGLGFQGEAGGARLLLGLVDDENEPRLQLRPVQVPPRDPVPDPPQPAFSLLMVYRF